ncbi:MAG: LysR family transcriptional regulator [Myxococcales bacterium]|nr:LysR family transcriptional regulator [Myxococcales bacterium]
MDSIGQMQVFVKVVELGGFTAAARELQIPKSTVSRQIARLEDRLSVRLLDRTTRALRTTEVGQVFYERCAQIVAEVEEAEALVTRAQVEPRGVLRMSAPVSLGYHFLGELVAAFMTEFSDVRLEVSLTDRKVDLVEEGYDLAIRAGNLADSSMIAKRLAPLDRVIVGSPAYLEQRGVPRNPDDLREHVCLQYMHSKTPSSWRLGPDTVVPVSGPLVSDNGDLLRAAAVAGHGLVMSPHLIVAADLKQGDLVRVLDDHLDQHGGIWAVYPHNRHLSPKVRAFVDFASTHLAEFF